MQITAATNRLIVIVVFAISLLAFFFSERITVNEGFGFDGYLYGNWAKNFYHNVVNIGVDGYSVQRILFPAIVHYSLRALSVPLTNANIINAFALYNIFFIMLIAVVWCLVSDELKISAGGKWLGTAGLLLNYQVLKFSFYYPVLTDIFAYALGMLMFYFYLKNGFVGLLLLSLIGAFIWPTALYIGLLLLLFPRDNGFENPAGTLRFPFAIALPFAGVLILLVSYGYIIKTGYVDYDPACIKTNMPLIYFSIALSVLYFFFGFNGLLRNNRIYDLKYLYSNIKLIRLVAIIMAFLLSNLVISYLVKGDAGGLGFKHIFLDILVYSIKQPGMFYVSHVVYFGPLLILAMLLWKHVYPLIHSYGPGLTFCTMIGFFFSLHSESRLLTHFYPFFVPVIVKAADSMQWEKFHYWFFAVLSFIFSKVWLKMNVAPIDPEKYLELPAQLYFMNVGPWMSSKMFVLQGAAVLVSFIIVYITMFHKRKITIQK